MVSVQAREVTIGGGHASGWLGPHHFGLGRAKKVSMRVIWPDGETSEWRDIEPPVSYNAGTLTIRELVGRLVRYLADPIAL